MGNCISYKMKGLEAAALRSFDHSHLLKAKKHAEVFYTDQQLSTPGIGNNIYRGSLPFR